MAAKAGGICAVTAWLFYRSAKALVFLIPLGIWNFQKFKRECARNKQNAFLLQFKEMIQNMATMLNTGYSVENALRETQKELALLYSEKEVISQELAVMVRQIRVQIPVEQVLDDFAGRVKLEDVKTFSAVFSAGKRSGGDLVDIIHSTSVQMSGKIEVKREIETLLAAKRYEFKVMSMIPYGIIFYMGISFPEFMSCLYGNVIGMGVMTVCLAIYTGASALGAKIVNIEV